MFAGPNGSGKSDLIKELQERGIPLGPFVNADKIAKQLIETGFIDFQDYELKDIGQDTWEYALLNNQELVSLIKKMGGLPKRIIIVENTLVHKPKSLNSYVSALIAGFLRLMLVDQGISFSYETVMSHSSKVEFLNYAKDNGYTAYLYYIATESPEINIARVQNRVAKGGHDVPEDKIRTRYYRSLDLLLPALEAADCAFLIDNSKKSNFVIFEKEYDGLSYPQVKAMPYWYTKYVLKKLDP